jgi:Ni,Fe-hydrogenase III large subunit/Ni,Fe-hydrogenase III component G
MSLEDLMVIAQRLPGDIPAWHARVDAQQWHHVARDVAARGGRLIALWGSDETPRGAGFEIHAAYAEHNRVHWLSLPMRGPHLDYPDVGAIFPCAGRMQRATYDLLGVRAHGASDTRPWLRHNAWSADEFPLRKEFKASTHASLEPYPFVAVAGDGVHEIPVGPVHAGIIEPGHFRFSVVGERVLRLEERLGYTHKGVEKRFESLSPVDGARLAGRISGDSTVAYAWAYAMALESATGTQVPERALWLRALALELERIANHLGDLGYLGNDTSLSFGFAQFWILKEDVLRLNQALFEHRYAMDYVVPGGVRRDLSHEDCARVLSGTDALSHAIARLRTIYDEHAGVQDRFQTTGIVTPDLATQLGLIGLAGRASAQSCDLRVQFPCRPYDKLALYAAIQTAGDVAARVAVRFDELSESLRLARRIIAEMTAGPIRADVARCPPDTRAFGWVEGWRGDVFIALHTGADGGLHRVHARDPSWANWPLLEHAVIGNIVPDFPLINKSFNLSYSGADL